MKKILLSIALVSFVAAVTVMAGDDKEKKSCTEKKSCCSKDKKDKSCEKKDAEKK